MPSIVSLPPEILADTFALLSEECHASYTRSLLHLSLPTDLPSPCPYSWIRLTHVCREWRWIAFSSSTLWRNIVVLDDEATSAMLSRASGHPTLTVTLRVTLSTREPKGAYTWTERCSILDEILRTKAEYITRLIMPADLDLLCPSFVHQAVQLKELIFINPYVLDVTTSPVARRRELTLPFAFPVLERVQYRAVAQESFNRVFCTTLKSLIIQHDWTDMASEEDDLYSDYQTTVNELLPFLAQMPHLEHLDIQIGDSTQMSRSVSGMVADLPRLRTLHIEGATPACAQLFSRLRIPGEVKIHFDCRLSDEELNLEVVPLPVILKTMFSGTVAHAPTAVDRFAPVRSLSFQDACGYYDLYAWRSDSDPFVTSRPVNPDVLMHCPWFNGDTDLVVLLAPFCLCDFDKIQRVRIGQLPCRMDDYMVDFTDKLVSGPGVRVLVLDELICATMLRLLKTTSATEIVLRGINFKPAEEKKQLQWRFSWTAGACIMSRVWNC